jgi:hypothetical protein
MAEDQKSEFSAQLRGNISNGEIHRLFAELGRHPLAERELREVKEAVFSGSIGSGTSLEVLAQPGHSA